MIAHPRSHGPFGQPVDTSSPLLQGLNPEQLKAITLGHGHALVLAGAGSGKTRVLTTRMAWLMQTGQVGPGGLMAVTFTNKAAKEMLVRLQAMLPVNVRGMWVGTFHGLCNRLLRAHWKPAGLPQTFQILDTQDQLSAMKRLCKQYNVDDERFPPKQLVWFVASCKEEGMRPGDVPVRDDDTKKKVEVYQLYEDQCQREGVVDFGELMLRSFELLRDHADIRQHYQQRFRHILVDEFQDTNKLQYAWLKQLVGPETAVLAVGDDDQSIYAFRGARVGNMADFLREFPDVSQVKLEQNYRSHSNILDAANHLIAHNSQRLGKNLHTDQGAGEPIRVFESPTDFEEARWLVDEIRQLVRGKGTALGAAAHGQVHTDPEQYGYARKEIAVLYRSNAQSRAIETALMNAAVPYKVYGGLRFFERAEIKHALAYLRLLENPRDDTSFMRVVNFPPRGIGARSIEQLQDVARTSGCALFDAVSAVTGRAGVGLTAFVAKLDVMREATQGQTLRDIMQTVLDQSGLLEHFRADRDGADRVENLEELVNAAESFVMQEGFGRDAVALPLDETAPGGGALRDGKPGPGLTQSPVSQGLVPPERAPAAHAYVHAQGNRAQAHTPVDPEDALADALAEANEAASRADNDALGMQDLFDFDSLPTTRPEAAQADTSAAFAVIANGQVDAAGAHAGSNTHLSADDNANARGYATLNADPAWADALDTGLLAVLPEETGETLSPLAAFLTHAALEAGDNQAQAGQDAVQLMTVHAAKGLEFDCVFITGLEEGLFPHENASSDRASLEEERRLMYVAITRARKRLYITHSQTRMLHGQTRYNLRSRFFDELPEACMRWLTPKAGAMNLGLSGGGLGGGVGMGASGYGGARAMGGAYSGGRSWGGASGASYTRADNPYGSSGDGRFNSKNATAPALEPKSGRGTDIAVGMKVFHTKFGEGKVLTVEGAAADARAQINFPRHGVKWLALSVAKLTVVED